MYQRAHVSEPIVLMGVAGPADVTFRLIRRINEASRRTGHITGLLVRSCVRLSCLITFCGAVKLGQVVRNDLVGAIP